MSNHEGGRLLNQVISKLDERKVFEFLGTEKTHEFLKETINLATLKYDCNSAEILEDYAQKFNICYGCLARSESLEEGLCPQCLGAIE
jgi:hypothetical protein